MRKGFWKAVAEEMPELSDVAIQFMCVHSTSCATELNWKLWGRVFTSARTCLEKYRAQKIISFCFNTRAQHRDMSDLALQLDVVEANIGIAEDDKPCIAIAGNDCEVID